MDNKESLAYWIVERENIRIAKEQGNPAPWSLDPVFQVTYFCNTRREDDKVTKWIRSYYTPEFFGNNYELAICAARIFNRPETLEIISNELVQFNPEGLLSRIHAMQDTRQQVWSGAYLITTHGQKMPKSVYCVETLEQAHKILPLTAVDTCERAHKIVMGIDGFGSFLAAQVVADLKNTKGHQLYNALDRETFSAPGPGSLRGLGWFYTQSYTPSTYQQGIHGVRDYLEGTTARAIVKNICNQDLQNCLCEYDKYMRVKNGTGRSKRKYKGTGT